MHSWRSASRNERRHACRPQTPLSALDPACAVIVNHDGDELVGDAIQCGPETSTFTGDEKDCSDWNYKFKACTRSLTTAPTTFVLWFSVGNLSFPKTDRSNQQLKTWKLDSAVDVKQCTSCGCGGIDQCGPPNSDKYSAREQSMCQICATNWASRWTTQLCPWPWRGT